MNWQRQLVTGLCAVSLALAPATEALAVTSAAQLIKILSVVNQVKGKVDAVKKEVDGLKGLTEDSNQYLKRIEEINAANGAALNTINTTLLANNQLLQQALTATATAAARGEANAALVGDAYASRAGHSSADVANAVSGCERGWAARLSGNASVMPTADGGTTSAAATIAEELAHGAGERQAGNTAAYTRALFGVPNSMKTGAQYSASAAFSEAELKKIKRMSWLTAPKPPSNTAAELARDGVRYGLARQVQAHWYAGLVPLSKGYGASGDLASRYAPEALPVVWQDDQALVPAHGLLRAEALSPWYDASPVDPDLSYSGWLLNLNQAGLLREQARLSVITNRLLYEMLVYGRWDTLIQAEGDLRR